MYRYYNPSPVGARTGDCSVRAISKALDVDWETAYAMLVFQGFRSYDMPSSNAIIGAVLRGFGFSRKRLPDYCPDCYTIEDFAKDHPHGTYVVCTGNHVVCVKNGIVYDAWDSSQEVPQFYWERK